MILDEWMSGSADQQETKQEAKSERLEEVDAKMEKMMEYMSPMGGLDWNYLEGLQASDISDLIKLGKVI